MFECVVFEHLGQLFDLGEDVRQAAATACQSVGISFITPPEALTCNTLKDLIVRDLHLPEDYYDNAVNLMLWCLKPGVSLKEFCQFDIPFYVLGTGFIPEMVGGYFPNDNFQGFLPSISELPHPLSKAMVVVDKEPCDYPSYCVALDGTNLESLISLLHTNC